MSWTRGAVVGERYRLEAKVGAGGMGEVWAAEHIGVGTRVAMKTLLAGDSQEPRNGGAAQARGLLPRAHPQRSRGAGARLHRRRPLGAGPGDGVRRRRQALRRALATQAADRRRDGRDRGRPCQRALRSAPRQRHPSRPQAGQRDPQAGGRRRPSSDDCRLRPQPPPARGRDGARRRSPALPGSIWRSGRWSTWRRSRCSTRAT